MDQFTVTAYELYPSPKRIRVMLAGMVIADSRRAILLRREHAPPIYFFPLQDLRAGVLQESGRHEAQEGYGEARFYTVRANSSERTDAAWSLSQPEPGLVALDRYIAFDWDAMDAWFEEDQEVFVHPHDPRTRIDIAPSSAHLQVSHDGVIVADSRRPVMLFETGLPTRYYLPRLDVRQELLVPSERVSYCPYKGEAHYYTLRLGGELLRDVVWHYRYPTAEAGPVAGLLCFYQERLEVLVDGERV